MGLIVAYSIVALLLLALAAGWYQPKKWQDLNSRTISILRFGCLFGFLVIVMKLAVTLL